jgi:hypothetical protein
MNREETAEMRFLGPFAGSRNEDIQRTGNNRYQYNKTGTVYTLQFTDIPKALFTPHHVGRCCTDAIRGHCCVFRHSCTNVNPGHCCVSGHFCNNVIPSDCSTMGTLGFYCCTKMGMGGSTVAKNATDRHGRAHKVFLVTLECEEHLIIKELSKEMATIFEKNV